MLVPHFDITDNRRKRLFAPTLENRGLIIRNILKMPIEAAP